MNSATRCHRLPETEIFIDFFRKPPQEDRHYILSHFHGDHYSGIKPQWNQRVHCTPITADLLKHIIGLASEFLVPHKLDVPFKLGETVITFIDANHCPGAAMILYQNQGLTHLHCGDCRFSHAMIANLKQHDLHTIFLDTTYGATKNCSSPQQDAIDFVAKKVSEACEKGRDDLAVFVGSYNLGKERIFLRLIEDLDANVFTLPRRLQIVQQLRLPEKVMKHFVKDRHNALVHVMNMKFIGTMWPYFQPNYPQVQKYMEEIGKTRAICFIPTGWANASKWNREHSFSQKDNISIHLVSYSEHSNLIELEEFMKSLKPAKIIPTVYKDESEFRKLKKHFNKFCRQESAMFDMFKRARKNNLKDKKIVPVPLKRIGSTASAFEGDKILIKTKSSHNILSTTKPTPAKDLSHEKTNEAKLLEMGFDPQLVASVVSKETNFQKAIDQCLLGKKRKAPTQECRAKKKPKFGSKKKPKFGSKKKKQKSITSFFSKKGK